MATDLKCIKSEHELTFGPNFGLSQIKKNDKTGIGYGVCRDCMGWVVDY